MNRFGSVLADLVLASRPLSWVNTAYPFGMAWLLATDVVSVPGVTNA